MQKKRILVVDDMPDLALLIRYHFRKLGYQVRSEGTAAEGLAAAKEMKPDLVILDLRLPDMDGREVCRILRSNSEAPILILTAMKEVYPARHCADRYLEKPFPLAALTEEAALMIARGRPEPARIPVGAGA